MKKYTSVLLALLALLAVYFAHQPDSNERRLGLAVLDRITSDGHVLLKAEQADAWDGVNDGRHHGFAAFGMHIARKPILLPVMRSARHLDTVHDAADPGRDGYGVVARTVTDTGRGTVETLTLAAAGEPVAVVTTRTRRYAERMTVFASVRFLPAIAGWYVKEPKWAAGPFVGRLSNLTVRDALGRELRSYDLSGYHDPRRSTKQLTQVDRRRVDLTMSGQHVSVYASGLADGSQRGEDWHDGPGLDQIRRLLQPQPRYSTDTVPAYCHADVLRPTWEVVVWPDRTTLLLNAGTGGVGFHDCLPTYRLARVLAGRTFTSLLRVEW